MARKEKLRIASELVEILRKYSEDRGYTYSEGLNELIRIGVAASPVDAVIDTEKKRAYREVQTYMSKRYAAIVRELAEDIERTFGFRITDMIDKVDKVA